MNFNVPQLAIDLETLAWSETAVITAWSATIFNFDKDIYFQIKRKKPIQQNRFLYEVIVLIDLFQSPINSKNSL